MGSVAVLISNMPIHDTGRHARLESNLRLMVEAADARLNVLATEKQLDAQREVLGKVEQKMLTALAGIDENYSAQREQGHDILCAMAQKIEASFYVLALSHEQEALVKEIVAKAEADIAAMFQQGLQVDQEFNDIMTGIRGMLAS